MDEIIINLISSGSIITVLVGILIATLNGNKSIHTEIIKGNAGIQDNLHKLYDCFLEEKSCLEQKLLKQEIILEYFIKKNNR